MALTRGINGIVKPARKLDGLLPTATEKLSSKDRSKKEKQTKHRPESSAKKDKTISRKNTAKLSKELKGPKKIILRLNPPRREYEAKEPTRSAKKQILKLNPPKGPAPETLVTPEKQDKDIKVSGDRDSPIRPLPEAKSVTAAAPGDGIITIQPAPVTTGAPYEAPIGFSAQVPAPKKEKAGKKTERRLVTTSAAKKAGRPKKDPAPDGKRGHKTGVKKSRTKNIAQTEDGPWYPPPFAPDHLLIRPTQAEIYKRYSDIGYTTPSERTPARKSNKVKAEPQCAEVVLGPEPRPRTPSPPLYSPITPEYSSVRHIRLPPPHLSPNRVVKPKIAGRGRPTISMNRTSRASSAPPLRSRRPDPNTIGDKRVTGYERVFSEDLDVLRAPDAGDESDEESWSQKVQEAFCAAVVRSRSSRRK